MFHNCYRGRFKEASVLTKHTQKQSQKEKRGAEASASANGEG